MMDEFHRFAMQLWYRVGLMGRQDWLLVALAVVVFGYYCAKQD